MIINQQLFADHQEGTVSLVSKVSDNDYMEVLDFYAYQQDGGGKDFFASSKTGKLVAVIDLYEMVFNPDLQEWNRRLQQGDPIGAKRYLRKYLQEHQRTAFAKI